MTQTVKPMLIDWGVPERKISLVPSFYLNQETLSSVPEVEKKYDIAFCARLASNKGLLELIDALKDLPDRTLIVIGDGPLRNSAEQRVLQLGIADRITFTGWLPDQADVLRTLRQANVFVMNSRSEGGPRMLLEAMCIGMPVVATPVGIAPDVITDGDNGLLTTGTASDLAQQLSQLLADDTKRQQMGERARGVLQKFDSQSAIKAYASFLQSLS